MLKRKKKKVITPKIKNGRPLRISRGLADLTDRQLIAIGNKMCDSRDADEGIYSADDVRKILNELDRRHNPHQPFWPQSNSRATDILDRRKPTDWRKRCL